jgi:acyl-coenzyme A thioesterase PaaI-like protein
MVLKGAAMKIGKHFKSLPTSADHNCFGCSPSNAAGLRMEFFQHADTVYSRVTIPDHLGGWNGVVHGGVVSAILDETMSWAAMVLLKRLSFTQKMTVAFEKTVAVGATMEAAGRIREVKDDREAVVEGLLTDLAGNLCAVSEGRFRLFSPAVAKRLKIVDDKMLAWFYGLFEGA